MLKKVFPLLLSYVFVTTQCWAISGGPNYGSRKPSPYGLYSGVITGTTESNTTTTGPSIPGDTLPNPSSDTTTTNSNAIGLFDLTVPTTGTATGAFLLFADGTVFGGTIDGSVDPDTDILKGIVQGGFSVDSTGTSGSSTGTAVAVGKINAKIGPSKNSSTVSARLVGTASVDVEFGYVDAATLAPIVNRVINFTVDGFRQSTSTTAAVATIDTAS